jgi:peroxiredoxin
MATSLVLARCLLALVFAVAALSKFRDRSGSRQAAINFGVPRSVAAAVGFLLPVAELATAVALVPAATAWWGGTAALVLLLVFIGAIGISLARGRRPDCHCFGQIHSAPVGWKTLLRNAALATVAAFIVWQGREDPGPGVGGWLSDMTVGQLVAMTGGAVLLGVMAIATYLFVSFMRQNGRILVRLDELEARLNAGGLGQMIPAAEETGDGLPPGTPAPRFSLAGLYGERLTLDFLRSSGKPVMLFFTDPGCGPCNALMPEIGQWQREHRDQVRIAIITRGDVEANLAKSSEHGLSDVLVQQDREVAQAFGENGTPSAVLVNPDGTIASYLAAGADAIRSLLARALGTPAPLPMAVPSPTPSGQAGNGSTPPESKIGERAPDLRLPSLKGKTVDLASMRGSDTLVLFWNPSCGYCEQMLDDLKAWESSRPKGAPELVVISTGTVEENRALGLKSPILLDPDFNVAWSFGANGTPMAVLVDANGQIASEVAAGASAVLALAKGGHQAAI